MGTYYAWVHYFCALNSPMIWLKGNVWHNVKSEVRRGTMMQCSYCKLNGATMGCNNAACHYGVHIPCAIKLGWEPSVVFRTPFLCPTHEMKATDIAEELICENDISNGRETVPVALASSLYKKKIANNIESIFRKGFRYTLNNQYFGSAIPPSLPAIDDAICCTCRDSRCVDEATCECLKVLEYSIMY
jgi:hypothetical protein